jgi:hypothetical protein
MNSIDQPSETEAQIAINRMSVVVDTKLLLVILEGFYKIYIGQWTQGKVLECFECFEWNGMDL